MLPVKRSIRVTEALYVGDIATVTAELIDLAVRRQSRLIPNLYLRATRRYGRLSSRQDGRMCRTLTDVLGVDEPGRVEQVILLGAVLPDARGC